MRARGSTRSRTTGTLTRGSESSLYSLVPLDRLTPPGTEAPPTEATASDSSASSPGCASSTRCATAAFTRATWGGARRSLDTSCSSRIVHQISTCGLSSFSCAYFHRPSRLSRLAHLPQLLSTTDHPTGGSLSPCSFASSIASSSGATSLPRSYSHLRKVMFLHLLRLTPLASHCVSSLRLRHFCTCLVFLSFLSPRSQSDVFVPRPTRTSISLSTSLLRNGRRGCSARACCSTRV